MIILDFTRKTITYVNGLSKKIKLYAAHPLNKYRPLTNTRFIFFKRCWIWYPNFIEVIFDVHWYLEQDHDKVLKLDIDPFPIKDCSLINVAPRGFQIE